MTNRRQAENLGKAVAAAAQSKGRKKKENRQARGREEEARDDGRTESIGRVPLGTGMNLSLPQAILDDIKAKELFPFWAKNDHSLQQYEAAGYSKYEDSNGNEIYRATKDSQAQHVLMVQPMKYHEEDLALQRRNNDANILEAGEGLESGQYIPDGRTFAVEKDRNLLPGR